MTYTFPPEPNIFPHSNIYFSTFKDPILSVVAWRSLVGRVARL
jgi:hypothetical protein